MAGARTDDGRARPAWSKPGLTLASSHFITVGTLFIVGSPAGNEADLTRRAQQILAQVSVIAAQDEAHANRLLAEYQIQTTLISTKWDQPAAVLAEGDVALLLPGASAGPSPAVSRLVRKAIDKDHPIVPIPGPSFPLTALVLSGMPSDSFVYLGRLPDQAAACCALLKEVQPEHRTLVIDLRPATPPDPALKVRLGDRHGVLVARTEQMIEVIWAGEVADLPEDMQGLHPGMLQVLVISGRKSESLRWDEDRLSTAIQQYLSEGLGVRESSQKLAAESGWPRRKIYRRAAQMAKPDRLEEG
jgi:16S rRNA (cytidine1402-2'-O)-methyltransferase